MNECYYLTKNKDTKVFIALDSLFRPLNSAVQVELMVHYMQSRPPGHGQNFNSPKRLSWPARVTFCAKLIGIL